MSQFFVQDGVKIEVPAPTYEGLPDSSAITPEFCDKVFEVFDDKNRFNEVGGWPQLNAALAIPMVLVMSIWDDVRASLIFFQTDMSSANLVAALRQHALARLYLPAREGGQPRRGPRSLPPGLWCSCRC